MFTRDTGTLTAVAVAVATWVSGVQYLHAILGGFVGSGLKTRL